MPKRIALMATAAALAVMPALAQQSAPPTSPGQGAQPSQQTQQKTKPGQMTKSFVDAQTRDQWLASTLIGLKVTGAGDENIGSIGNLLVEPDGKVIAAVIGVGGFLGIGQKEVAVAFDALNISRSADGTEKVTLQLTKAELETAPDFKPFEPPRPAAQKPTPGGTPGASKAPGSGM